MLNLRETLIGSLILFSACTTTPSSQHFSSNDVYRTVASAEMSCQIEGQAKCICSANLMVRCDGFGVAQMSGTEKPKRVEIQVQNRGASRTFVITNPSNNASAYIDASSLPEVKAQLKKAHYKLRASDEVNARLIFDSSTPLFEDAEATRPLNAGSAGPVVSDTYADCGYAYKYPPRIVDHQGAKACAAVTVCHQGPKPEAPILSICALKGDTCPDATTCTNDMNVHQLPGEILSIYCIGDHGFAKDNCTPAGVPAPGVSATAY
jgi:hypothetical protein